MCQRTIVLALAATVCACGPPFQSDSPDAAEPDAAEGDDASSSSAPPAICGAPQGTSAAAATLVDANTSFAVTLYGPAAASVATPTAPNVILSPFSLSTVLTMIDAGVAGATDAQIKSVLRLPGNGASVAPALATVACQDETDASWGGQRLSVANAVWGQQGKSFESAFLTVLTTDFQSPFQQADFAGDPTGAASTINGWVSRQTQGTIPSLLQPGDVDSSTAVVLVDAVYFKGAWAAGFDPSQTAPGSFILDDGTTAEVPMMRGNVNLASGSLTAPAVATWELAYAGGALAMDFLVPDSQGSLSSFVSTLTPDVLNAALASIGPASTQEFLLPKFSFSTRIVLNTLLSNMGMPDAFEPGVANLSGFDGMMDLSLTTVVQQAFVEVDESGTTAAAATAGVSGNISSSLMPGIYSPFVFLIRDTKNGSILFIGQVGDPRQGS